MSLPRALLLGGLLALIGLPAAAATPQALTPDASLRFTGGSAEAPAATPWWQDLDDPALAGIIDEAMGANLDLERFRAMQRQREAAALQSFSALSPSITAQSQTSLAPTESLGFPFLVGQPRDPNAPKTYYTGSATLNAQWSIDVFGRNAASWRAAQRDVQASENDLDGLAGQTAALVANAYYDVVIAKERVALIEQQIQTNQELLEVIALRYERGDASSLDVLQQRQTLATTQSQLPGVRLQAQTAAQRLAVLLGRPPMQPPTTASELPELGDEVRVGTPADLVENRPDLRAEAARLEGTRDRRWSSYAAALPSVGVSGTAGYQYVDQGEFIDQTYWNAGLTASFPIFAGGRNLGAVRQARAAHDLQAAAFEGAVLTAMQEVEGALAQERLQREAVEAQQTQLDAATEAADTARRQYLEGLTPFVNVQTAITRRQQAELSVLQGRRDLVAARISVLTAVGGPWTRAVASQDFNASNDASGVRP